MRKVILIAIIGGVTLLFTAMSPLSAGTPKDEMCPTDQHTVCYDKEGSDCECIPDQGLSGCKKCPCYLPCGNFMCRVC